MKKCLLIIPKHFYTFEKQIREALLKNGYSVVVSNDEYPEGLIGKIIGKLQLPIVFLLTYFNITRRYLKDQRYDICLIFKGRGISAKLIKKMHRHVDKIIGYNYDSFKLNRAPLKWYKYATRYFTFDYMDAEKLSLPVVELFSAAPTINDKKEVKYQLSAIVRNHSRRLNYIDRVISILQPSKVFIFIYELNIFTFIINFLRNPRLYIKYRQHISFKPMKYTKYSDVMKCSRFTIDYAHDTQTGITMRCFEAIKMQTKIITNNLFVRRSDYFNSSNCIVFTKNTSPQELVRSYYQCQSMPYTKKSRTIYNFLSDLDINIGKIYLER